MVVKSNYIFVNKFLKIMVETFVFHGITYAVSVDSLPRVNGNLLISTKSIQKAGLTLLRSCGYFDDGLFIPWVYAFRNEGISRKYVIRTLYRFLRFIDCTHDNRLSSVDFRIVCSQICNCKEEPLYCCRVYNSDNELTLKSFGTIQRLHLLMDRNVFDSRLIFVIE